MITDAQNYREQREELMKKWEKESRDWIEFDNDAPISANFFKDGIFDPDTWFQNDFRPLFILKEVHDNAAEENRCIDFVAMDGGKDYDVWNGKGMWLALGTLARGILDKNNGVFVPYDKLRAGLNTPDLKEYHETLRHIAMINIKKLSSGSSASSDESRRTKYFECHAQKFKENLQKQIEQIKPTVVICCGSGIESCFDITNGKLYDIPVVSGLHPDRNPNCRRKAFYDDTIEKVFKHT